MPEDLVGLRCLLGMLGLDVHSKGIRTLARLLRDRGAEVVYIGEHNSPAGMARAAVTEDVDVVGVSFSTTTSLDHSRALLDALTAEGAPDLPVMVGGLVHGDDEPALRAAGVSAVFGPGADIDDVVAFLQRVRDGVGTGPVLAPEKRAETPAPGLRAR